MDRSKERGIEMCVVNARVLAEFGAYNAQMRLDPWHEEVGGDNSGGPADLHPGVKRLDRERSSQFLQLNERVVRSIGWRCFRRRAAESARYPAAVCEAHLEAPGELTMWRRMEN